MKEKKQNAAHMWKNNIYFLKIAFKACPSALIWSLTIHILTKTQYIFLNVMFLRYIINAIETKQPFGFVFLYISIITAVFFIIELLNSLYTNKYKPINERILFENINLMMFEKATDVELACYEDPDFYNSYTKAISQANGKISYIIDNMFGFIGQLIANIFAIVTILTIDPYAILFTVVPLLFAYFFGKKLNENKFKRDMDNVPYSRRKDYVKRTIYLQKFSKEFRLSNIFNVLQDTLEKAVSGAIKNIKKYGFKLTIMSFLQDFVNFNFVFLSAFIYATIRMILYKNLLIGDYIALINAIVFLACILVNMIYNVILIQLEGLYIQNFRDFLNYKPKISESQDGIIPDKELDALKLDNVSFSYQNKKDYQIKNLVLSLRRKEKIAIVGHNGAGKSTLIKLIMRLYDTTNGDILHNGVNIKELNVKEYRQLFGTVFQDFQVLSMSVAENVLMDEVADGDEDKIIDALKQSGIYDKIQTLDNGINSTLTREFDDNGAVLSSGEYQKITISRVFAKDCAIVILDEPSSALDPVSEYQIFESMMNACRDRAVIFISHRLSSTVLADKIYMLENGEIIEQGTHKELMKMNGRYAKMFNLQAEKYQEGAYNAV